jgi:hypothetical protein
MCIPTFLAEPKVFLTLVCSSIFCRRKRWNAHTAAIRYIATAETCASKVALVCVYTG